MDSPIQPASLTVPYVVDQRGSFSKPFHKALPQGASLAIREIYWTVSSRGVVRGLHFQEPPHAVNKLVWVSQGSALDVVVDVRRHSEYGKTTAFPLSGETGTSVWIPVGFAHGFQALEDDTIVNYAVDDAYSPENDCGVRWDSIAFDWPLPVGPVSERDAHLPRLEDYRSPFEGSS